MRQFNFNGISTVDYGLYLSGEKQPFRIYKIDRPLNGTVTVYAQHISYQLSRVVVMPGFLHSRNKTDEDNRWVHSRLEACRW